MKSQRRRILLLATTGAVLIGCLLCWQSGKDRVTGRTEAMKPKSQVQGETKALVQGQSMIQAAGATLPSSSVSGVPATLTKLLATAPRVVPETERARKEGVMGRGLPLEVRQGQIVERQDSPVAADGTFQRTTVYRTSFKYPFVRVEQSMRRDARGQETVTSQFTMVADHLMVKTQGDVDEAALTRHLAPLGLKVRRHLPGTSVYLVAVRGPGIRELTTALSVLEKSPVPIILAEPDFIVQAVGAPVIPDDASFNLQWNMHNTGQNGGTVDADIDAPEAWSVSTGSANVVVAVIDTGMDLTHPDLAANLWTNPDEIPGNGIDDDGNGYIDDVHGWNFVAGSNSPDDDHGHGTHTGGTVGAVGGNGTGVTGVCQTVRLMPLKFLNASGSGTDSDGMDAIHYATVKGVFLSSNSWGGAPYDPLMLTFIQEANTAGVGFVAAAGNSGMNTDLYPEYPGSYSAPNLISVAATDNTDTLGWFSNYGVQTVNIAAPGVQTYSTMRGSSYAYMSGTSMATPHVAGAAALLKAANPTLSFAQVKAMLLATTDTKTSLAGKMSTGARLNVANAMVPATGPVLSFGSLVIDDTTGGDGNGIASPGENINVLISIANIGGFTSTNVQGTLALSSPPVGVTLTNATASYGNISASAITTNTVTPFTISIDSSVTPTDVPMTLTLTDDAANSWTVNAVLKIRNVSIIAGTVTKLTGGGPLSGAAITITGPDNQTLTTGANGSFIATVTNGTYTVQAMATGYIPSSVQTVNVPPAAANLSFALGYSQGLISPTALSSIQLEGEVKTQTFTLHNSGDQAMTYDILDVPPPDTGATSNHLVLSSPPARSATPGIQEMLPSKPLSLPLPSRTRDASDNWAVTLPFRDGFEDGMWGRWWSTGGDGTREVVSNTAGTGSKSFHFHFNGPDDHFTGIHQIFDWQQPGHISFWTRPGPEDLATSYMVLLDSYYTFDSTGFHQVFIDFIWFFANANGRFYLNDDVGGNQTVVYTENQWYHVEFRNINWSTKKFDYWVDGQLVQAGVPFRNPDASYEMVYALNYNYSGDTDSWLDDAVFSNDALPWISLSSKQGTIPPGGTVTVTATFDATHELAGHYTGTLQVRTNDPVTPNTNISVDMTVNATPNNPPVATAQTVNVAFNNSKTITLAGSDADNDNLTYRIVSLPPHGKIYRTSDGSTPGYEIANTPAVLTGPPWQVIYQAEANDSGAHHGDLAFTVSDAKVTSAPATVRVDVVTWPVLTVTPPGGMMSAPLSVVFTSSNPSAVVHLTTDGSGPIDSSYSLLDGGSMFIDHTVTISAIAAYGTNISPAQSFTFTFPDANNNDLPDWREAMHPDLGSASSDDDHDGFTNWEEFTANTDPNKADHFGATAQDAGSAHTITWPSSLGRSYIVEFSTNLTSWSPASSPMAGTGSTMSWEDSAPSTLKFYRVRVTLQ